MAKNTAKSFQLQAVPDNGALHIILPASVSRLAMERVGTGHPVPMFGVITNGVIQLSYERLELSIPALTPLTEDQFVPATQ